VIDGAAVAAHGHDAVVDETLVHDHRTAGRPAIASGVVCHAALNVRPELESLVKVTFAGEVGHMHRSDGAVAVEDQLINR